MEGGRECVLTKPVSSCSGFVVCENQACVVMSLSFGDVVF